MSDGYYDPHPLLRLLRPVVLIGHPGCGVDAIGRAVSGRTGLPFNDVERMVESLAGAACARVAREQGDEALRAIEGRALAKALRRQPSGIVVVTSRVLDAPGSARWLRERADAAFVRRPFELLFARIRERVAPEAGQHPDFLDTLPEQPDDLATRWAAREREVAELEWFVEGEAEAEGRIAGAVIEALEGALGAESLLR